MTLTCKLFIGHPQKLIGEIEIGNVTRDPSRMSSDYIYRIKSTDAANKSISAAGYLVDSYNSSAVELLYEILAEWKSGRKNPIDNHGQERTAPEGINLSAEELWNRLVKIEEE